MNTEEFITLRNSLHTEAEKVLESKGWDYPTSDDRLSNFKSIASIVNEILGRNDITPGLVWFIYEMKHIIPFTKWVVEGKQMESESPFSRAVDIANYNELGLAIGAEQDAPATPKFTDPEFAKATATQLYDAKRQAFGA